MKPAPDAGTRREVRRTPLLSWHADGVGGDKTWFSSTLFLRLLLLLLRGFLHSFSLDDGHADTLVSGVGGWFPTFMRFRFLDSWVRFAGFCPQVLPEYLRGRGAQCGLFRVTVPSKTK